MEKKKWDEWLEDAKGEDGYKDEQQALDVGDRYEADEFANMEPGGVGNPEWEENDLREARELHQRTLREAKSIREGDKEDMGRSSDDVSYEGALERIGYRSGQGGI